MTAVWEARADASVQVDRILDAVGRCARRGGVEAVTLVAVAAEAGCSRPTVYRYFPDRDALRLAFVEREARRLGAAVAAEVAGHRDPQRRLVAAVTGALRGVRSDPVLQAWVAPASSGASGTLAAGSPLLTVLARWALRPPGAAAEPPAPDRRSRADEDARAAWLVRVVFSLLAQPGRDEAEEARWLARFVVPVVLPDAG